VNKDDVGMATWSSAEPEAEHQLSIRDLRQGKFVGNYQYVVEYGPLGKEWLVVNGGTITDYFFIRHAGKTPDGSRVGETHFTLRRAERTDELDRLLRHPPAGE
jgi:hypothetical protein